MGTWHGLVNQPTFHTSTMILLTDGRIMVQEEATNHWHALSPDSTGSYLNGTWSQLADMQYFRRYYASGILKDGRVIVCGGEQNNVGAGDDTNNCQIYDPASNTWTTIAPPSGWPNIGDASCCILPDGNFMIGNINTPACAIYNPVTNTWSSTGSKAVRSNEETWILLPDNCIVTPQCFAPYQSEKYIISTGTWKNEGAIPVSLVNHSMAEIGPGMLLYNGKVIYFGADGSTGHGKTAIYTPSATPAGTGTWAAGPDIPLVGGQVMVANDCPATLLPNGNVLFVGANYLPTTWGSPIYLFEYNPTTNTITQATTPSNNGAQQFWSRLMLLPTGQVMFSPSSNNVQVYDAGGTPNNAWRPTVSSVAQIGSSGVYTLTGTQLNGLSQANIYGDDCYPATNYPLVTLKSGSGNVHFAKTHTFSTMGVATGATPETCQFDAQGILYGNYTLNVIANGISSDNHAFSAAKHGLVMGWKGMNNDQSIWYSYFDGTAWIPQNYVSGVATSHGPSLAFFNGKVYMAWKGMNTDQGIWYSSFDGADWAPQQQVPGVATSVGPSLAVYNGSLYMAWKGMNADQGIWYSHFNGSSWAAQQQVSGVATSVGPSLAVYNGSLYMAWKGMNADQGIYYSHFNGTAWAAQQQVAGVATSVGPSLAAFNGSLYMAWKGMNADQGIYYSHFNGTAWAAQQEVSGVATSVGPCLSVFNGALYMAWKGMNADQGIWYSHFNGTSWVAQQEVAGVATSVGPQMTTI